MSDTRNDSGFVDSVKSRFDDSVRNMAPATAARVARARAAALAETGGSNRRALWLPAGAAVTACLALIVYSLLPDQSMQQEPETVIEQMDLISNLEFYENLEFYQWLERDELPS